MDDIEIFSCSSIEETINFLKILRKNEPIFWSNKYNAWVITKYEDIKNILFDNINFPMYLGNDINVISNINIDSNELNKRYEERTKYSKVVDFYGDYFKGMPTAKFIENTKTSIIDIFDNINYNKKINITNEINYLNSILFICNFINFSKDLTNKYLKEAKYINNFLDDKLIQERLFSITHSELHNSSFHESLKENLNNIYQSDTVYYSNILIGFVNSHMQVTQTAITGLQNGILYLINKNLDIFQNLNILDLNKFLNECIRYITFNSHICRKCIKDIKINNTNIKAGDNVILMLGSGNFDEDIFGTDSTSFNIYRNNNARTIEFGFGPHFCTAYRGIKYYLYEYLLYLISIKNNFIIDNIVYDADVQILGSPIKEIYGTFYK